MKKFSNFLRLHFLKKLQFTIPVKIMLRFGSLRHKYLVNLTQNILKHTISVKLNGNLLNCKKLSKNC